MMKRMVDDNPKWMARSSLPLSLSIFIRSVERLLDEDEEQLEQNDARRDRDLYCQDNFAIFLLVCTIDTEKSTSETISLSRC